MAGKEDKT